MQNVSIDSIAKKLGVSVSEVRVGLRRNAASLRKLAGLASRSASGRCNGYTAPELIAKAERFELAAAEGE